MIKIRWLKMKSQVKQTDFSKLTMIKEFLNIVLYITLTFCPTEKINVNGMLILINNYTNENYFYILIGNVEEPLTAGNLQITNINAKECIKK